MGTASTSGNLGPISSSCPGGVIDGRAEPGDDYSFEALENADDHVFLVEARMSPFQDGHFRLGCEPISTSDTGSIAGTHVARFVKLFGDRKSVV